MKHEPMQKPKGLPHPSGKPERKGRWGTETRYRIPDGPLTPGLQRQGFTDAVGFTARLTAEDFD